MHLTTGVPEDWASAKTIPNLRQQHLAQMNVLMRFSIKPRSIHALNGVVDAKSTNRRAVVFAFPQIQQ